MLRSPDLSLTIWEEFFKDPESKNFSIFSRFSTFSNT